VAESTRVVKHGPVIVADVRIGAHEAPGRSLDAPGLEVVQRG